MSPTEALLRLSIIQVEMLRLANALGPKGAKIVRYAATILNLLQRL